MLYGYTQFGQEDKLQTTFTSNRNPEKFICSGIHSFQASCTCKRSPRTGFEQGFVFRSQFFQKTNQEF
jgi:hypothetical protein